MEQLENSVNSRCTSGDGETREVTLTFQQTKYMKPVQIKYFRIAPKGKYFFFHFLHMYLIEYLKKILF